MFRKHAKGKKVRKIHYEKCSICGSSVKESIRDKGLIPYGLKINKRVICSDCLNNLNEENNLIIEGYRLETEPKEDKSKNSRNSFFPRAHGDRIEMINAEDTILNENDELESETTQYIYRPEEYIKQMSFNEMVESMKKVVKGQDLQIEKLCATIVRNSTKNSSEDKSKRKNHIIIVGDSGTGKTLMLDELARVTNKVCSYENATSYTEEGYVGDSVYDMLFNLIDKAGGDLKIAQKGIIVIDEGDKKAGANTTGRDVAGYQVLFGMLKMLDGAKLSISRNKKNLFDSNKIIFDTSELTFVFIGVFPGIDNILKKRLTNKSSIGFSSQVESVQYANEEIMPRDFIPLGFPKEFIARFSVVIKMNKMTEDTIKYILLSESSYLHQEIARIREFGVNVIMKKQVIDEMAKEVMNQNIGARGIEQVVNYVLENVWYSILKNNELKICKIMEGITKDNTKYSLS